MCIFNIRIFLPPYSGKFILSAIFAVIIASCQQTSDTGKNREGKGLVGTNHLDLAFSTYLGGSKYDSIRDIFADSRGNIYVVGGTDSPNFPTTKGALATTYNGGPMDAYVMKLDSDGHIIWSTYLGGPSYDRAYAVEVDNRGDVYVAGRAGIDFPATEGAFQTMFYGGIGGRAYPSQDNFIAKLSADGSNLIWASYFGAKDDPGHPIRDMAIDQYGNVYIGTTSTTGAYPPAILKSFRKGFQPMRTGSSRDGVVAKISPDGSQVLWATYLGGSDFEWGEVSIRVDETGNVYFLTVTASPDAPTTSGAYDTTFNGDWDFYLAKLTPDGTNLIYGTYLGGSKMEHLETHELEVDIHGNAYVVAGTTSPDFPTTPGAFQNVYAGSGGRHTGRDSNYPGDVIVAKISNDGSKLLASTFVGGKWGESAEGVAVDHKGNVYFTGATYSKNFPVTKGAFQTQNGGKSDFFACKLSADFSRLIYSTYLGGDSPDLGRTAAINSSGHFFVAGMIDPPGSGWPIRNPLQGSFGGGNADAVLAKFTSNTKFAEFK
jgi:hypothetical protein